MQKQNILKYATNKYAHPTQNSQNPVMFENAVIMSRTNQQLIKKPQQTSQNCWKSTRVHTQGSQPTDKKTTLKSFLDKERAFKHPLQFRSKQNQRKTFDDSTGKIQKGHSQKVFKYVGNFVNINKNDSLRKQKAPDFFPISSKERKSSVNKFNNNLMGNVQFEVRASKFRQENIMKVGSPNIYFKQQQSANNFFLSPPQKSYLRRNVKTQSDQVQNGQIKPQQKTQVKYFRKSFNNGFRKTQHEDHSFLYEQKKYPMESRMVEKSCRNNEKFQLNANIYLKQNKQNRKTIFESDEPPMFEKFQYQNLKTDFQKDQMPKAKSPQNVFSFLNKSGNKAQIAQKLNQNVSIIKKQRPNPENDRKQARVNTEENQKPSKPYFLKQKSTQQMSVSLQQKNSTHQQAPTINWQRDLVLKQKVGEGTFGKVYKATLRTDSSKLFALKSVMIDKKYKSRQVEIVSQLSHPQVMKVHGTFVTVKQNNEYLNIVMDYYDHNLYEVINEHGQQSNKQNKNVFGSQKRYLQLRQKVYLYQLLRSLSYIHSLAICHRDIKPHNMLVRSWQLVLCDFGSAKRLIPGEPNLSYICSRCYRAPQLIFGSTAYTTQIDIWSVACVILEMLNDAVPLFIGENSLQHLLEVIKIVGTPTKEQVRRMNENYDVSSFDLPIIKRKQLSKLFPHADPLLVDLVEKILVYDPEKRLTAIQALGHSYFDDLRNREVFNQLSYVLPKETLQSFFVFDSKELEFYRQKERRIKSAYEKVSYSKNVQQARQILVPAWKNTM